MLKLVSYRFAYLVTFTVVSTSACVTEQVQTIRNENKGSNNSSLSAQSDPQKRAKIRLQLAINYYEQQQFLTALEEVDQALNINPDFPDAYSVKALIYMSMGDTKLAEKAFQSAISLSPNNPDFLNNYGWFLCQNDSASQSINYFDKALDIKSYQSPAKALNNAGVCSLKIKKENQAEIYLSRAFKYDPSNIEVNFNLSKIYYSRSDYKKAKFYSERAVKSAGVNSSILWNAIKIDHALNDKVGETDLVTQLRKKYPNSAEFAAFQRGAYDE